MRILAGWTILLVWGVWGFSEEEGGQASAVVAEGVESLVAEAERLLPLIETDAVRELLAGVPHLPAVETRTFYVRRKPFGAVSAEAYRNLPRTERDGFSKVSWGTERYYAPMFGTALAYARALDVAAKAGLDTYTGKRIFDFGYGGITQLRLLAAVGADIVGADPGSYFPALYYDESDQGSYGERGGRVTLAHGYWPEGEGMAERVGGDFDLIVSKNVLKRGYVRPRGEVTNPLAKIELQCDHEAFVRSLADALAPGGLLLIYNLGNPPSQEGEPYRPQDDIGSPFTQDEFRAVGLEVIEFDRVDSEAFRKHADAFGWYEGNLHRLHAQYTLLRKPAGGE